MWQLGLCVGVICLIIEMFIPTAFFLSFSLSAFICSIISLFTTNITILTISFCVLSICLLFLLRPYVLKKDDIQKSGIQEKYIGKQALAVDDIDKNKGTITIYDERWQARNIDDGIIEKNSNVEIINNKSIVMYVKKID